jgi:Flp pilus assembly protein TadG
MPQPASGGQALVIVGLAVVALFAAAAFAIDLALAFKARQELQQWVDASALAGALDLPNSVVAQQKAAEFYARNLSPTAPPPQQTGSCAADTSTDMACYNIDLDSVSVTTPYTKSESSISPSNLVHVTACRDVSLTFARVIGIRTMHICAAATAKKMRSPSGILVLDPTGRKALDMSGGSQLNLPNGDVVVDSSDSDAFNISGGNSGITANEISITGNYSASGGSADNLHPTPQTGQPPERDPLAGLPAPSTAGLPVYPGIHISSTTATLSPGVYAGQIVISGTSVVKFNPGIYIMKDGITVSGGSTIFGNEIMLYSEGQMTFSGTSIINLSPPGSGAYQGITMFQARGNTDKAVLSGGSGSILAGTYYFPDTQLLELSGGSNMQLGFLVTWRMLLSGGSFQENSDSSSSNFIALED